jgi:hypothetical protein
MNADERKYAPKQRDAGVLACIGARSRPVRFNAFLNQAITNRTNLQHGKTSALINATLTCETPDKKAIYRRLSALIGGAVQP